MTPGSVAVLCGGVGAARFLAGLVAVVPPEQVTAVVNTADDLTLHGLHISPDLDTVTYTLAGQVDGERGWGLVGESWQAMETLRRYGGVDWFNLGDRDLGTHLYRTHRLGQGASLSEVTAEVVTSWDLRLQVLPVTDDRLRTMVTVPGEGEIDFQEYFVHRRHATAVSGVRFAGVDDARPAPGVLDALAEADVIVIAPSNPVVSIDPVLAVAGVREAVADRRERVIAVSPIVGGRALKGPAADLLSELGHEPSAAGVARYYAGLTSTLVIDHTDEAMAEQVRAAGVRPLITETVMATPEISAGLAARTIEGI